MSIFKDIMDKLSGGSYGKHQDTDIKKVIAERDELLKELSSLADQYNEIYAAAQEIIAAKKELLDCIDRLVQENLILRTALGSRVNTIEVKN